MPLFGRRNPNQELLEASASVDVRGVKKALSRKADPNSTEPTEGQSPLHLCIRGRKGPPQPTPAGTARAYRPVENVEATVDLLLQAGASPSAVDNDGVTPLHWACAYDFVPIAKRLLKAGADLHAADNLGITPIHQAADAGATEVARVLIEAGANVNGRTNEGYTPLALAEGKQVLGGGRDAMEPIRELLRQHGATR